MKDSRSCPKCSGTKVVRVPGGTSRDVIPNAVFMGLMKARIAVTRFVCTDCGYSEEWIEAPEDRAKIRRQYGAD